MRRLDFRILGPLEVRADGEPLAVGGPKQRALLATLLMSANRVVSRERLIEELWPDQGAGAAQKTLRVSIGRLRTALSGEAAREERLVTRAPGYVLRVEPGELDLERFERIVAAAREALEREDFAPAAAQLREADALWAGRPLADLEFEPFARVDVERLQEQRLAAAEDRFDAELALGRHSAVVAELDTLTSAHPLRERLRGQLMLALYRSGRQAEALAAYRDGRSLLVEEQGLDPSPWLQDLECAILRQDAALGGTAVVPVPTPASAPLQRDPPAGDARVAAVAPRGGRGRRVALGALAAVCVALGVLVAGGHGGGHIPGHAAKEIHTPAFAFLDARSGKLLAQVPAIAPGIIRYGEGSIWAMQQVGVVQQIDPRTLKLVRAIPLGDIGGGSDFAVGEGAVWVTERSKVLLRVDPRYGTVSRVALPQQGLAHPGAPGGVAVGARSLWVAQGMSRVLRLDPVTGRVEHRFALPGANVVAFGEGAAWVASATGDVGRVTKIDARTNTIAASARVGSGVPCLAVGGGFVWGGDDGRVHRVSLDGDALDTIKLDAGCGGMSYGAGGLWVANDMAGIVMRIEPQTERITRYRLGNLLTGIGVAGHIVAVAAGSTPDDLVAGITGRILRVSYASAWPDFTDPATAGAVDDDGKRALEQQLQDATCARLLRFGEGAAAGQLVPEVATAAPAVSADGRTYTFDVRDGYRFSPPSNAPVTPATFKYSIERALSPRLGAGAPGARVVPDVAGLRAYRTRAARHISGITAAGETLTIRLVHRAPDFPERIAATYFCPVPIGTTLGSPAAGDGGLDQPIPSAGPYYLTGAIGGAIDVLRRNPNYRGPRPQHLDAVIYRARQRLEDAVAGVAVGDADYVAERGPALAADSPTAARLESGAGGRRRYALAPLLGIDELVFDSRRGLFASAAVRRAVNLALDRRALAAILGDIATDRYLPAGMPGASTRHVYPLARPRLRVAQAIMAGRSGIVRLAVCSEPACARVGRAVARDLRRLGIQVRVTRYNGHISGSTARAGANLVLARVLAPYPDPAAFLRVALGRGAPRQRLHTIALLDRPHRLAAAATLEQHLLVDVAPAAAIGTPAIPELFSARVGCRISSGVSFGTDLAALCLRGR